jgi:predicted CXXCH cytochrome family protein
MECHNAHQSPRETLLTAPFDGGLRVRFSEDAFALCFNCHDVDAFQEPVVDDETGFRQGDRNLHYVHLIGDAGSNRYGIEQKRKKRMSCTGCHLLHASSQPKLIRPSRKRGTVTVYTIDYQETGQGGSCVVGCHKPRQYRRDGSNAPPSRVRAASASHL